MSCGILEERGIRLGSPHTSQVHGSKHGHMRELRAQVFGRPFRVFYAVFVPLADAIDDAHLEELAQERPRRRT